DSAAGLTTIDASGSAVDIYAGLFGAGTAELATITMGSGSDVIALGDQADLSIDLGAGNDTLYIGGAYAGNDITTGEGSDWVQFTGLISNITAPELGEEELEDSFAEDIITIADFDGGADVLAFGASGPDEGPREVGAPTLVGGRFVLNN